jgi:hypothetical protein
MLCLRCYTARTSRRPGAATPSGRTPAWACHDRQYELGPAQAQVSIRRAEVGELAADLTI